MAEEHRQLIDIAALRPHPRNYNRHSPEQVAYLAESLKQFQQRKPLTTWRNIVLTGHGVFEAAKLLGWSKIWIEPCPDEWTEIEALAWMAADNELARLAEPDNAQLAAILQESAAADAELLEAIGYGEAELERLLLQLDAEGSTSEKQITKSGRLYNAGDGHDVEPFKLAYRVEAAWRANGGKAIDLFSGEGQLASWYRRRFDCVITIDNAYDHGDVDYSMNAMDFIHKHLDDHIDFDFIDFDDEGCPAREIQAFFAKINGKRDRSFVLALTDGNGMNMKFRGRGNLGELYLVDGDSMRQLTRIDYNKFDEIVTAFVHKVAAANGFSATAMSSYRGRAGNVLFQTWMINLA